MIQNKKINFFLLIFALILIIFLFPFILSGCGGGGGGGSASSSGGGNSGGNAAFEPAPTPTPEPTPEPSNKGAVITISTPDRSVYAVLIGIADYPGGTYDGKYQVNDAMDIKDALIDSALWNEASINIQNNIHVTKSIIQEAVNNAKTNIADNGLFVFFFSGTALGELESIICLVPFDGLNDDSKLINLRTWLDEFSATSKKYILIDTPTSGSLVKRKNNFVFGKNLPGSFPARMDEKFVKSLLGLANTYVMTSCRCDEWNYTSSSQQNSIFSYYLCEGLGVGNAIGPADANNDNEITAEDLTNYVAPRVTNAVIESGDFFTNQMPQSYDNYPGELRIK